MSIRRACIVLVRGDVSVANPSCSVLSLKTNKRTVSGSFNRHWPKYSQLQKHSTGNDPVPITQTLLRPLSMLTSKSHTLLIKEKCSLLNRMHIEASSCLQCNIRQFSSIEDMTVKKKAEKFNRPKAQTTIDEEEVNKFSELSALWWDEGGEFEALHSLNDLRIPLMRDALVTQKRLDQYSLSKPLDGFWILDVGSGGGILTEPLARLGAFVVGIEASEENIKIAQAHLIHDPEIREHVKYIQATVEDIAETQAGKFDAVVASEVLEHVADANTFVSSCCKLVKPGGSIFFTTLNKTYLSYALGIVVAERMLRLVSPGTHDWDKFVSPMDLEYMLERNNFSTRLVHGMFYNPLSKRWSWASDTSINYAIHAVRPPATEGEEDNAWTQDGQ